MNFNEIAVFIQVVQSGSFTAAAKQLQMPNSTVSFKISELEKRLGVSLLQRTTRKLHVTPLGQAFFEQCLRGLESVKAAEASIIAASGEPQGLLRVTAPVELGSSVLPSIVSSFVKKYPKVSVEIILADRKVDLLAEGVDLAIRAGALKDSSMKALRLGAAYFAAFASPKYLKQRGNPKRLEDLQGHTGIGFTPLLHTGLKFSSSKSNSTRLLELPGQLIINDLNMIKVLALAGEGIAILPTFMCRQDESGGKLVRVLPEWTSDMQPVHFVYLSQRFVPPKLSAFMQHAGVALKENLQV